MGDLVLKDAVMAYAIKVEPYMSRLRPLYRTVDIREALYKSLQKADLKETVDGFNGQLDISGFYGWRYVEKKIYVSARVNHKQKSILLVASLPEKKKQA